MDKRISAVYSTLAQNIVRLRGKMSQEALASKAKVSRTTIYNMERGAGCSIANLVRVAYALRVNPGELLNGEHQLSVVELLRKALHEEIKGR